MKLIPHILLILALGCATTSEVKEQRPSEGQVSKARMYLSTGFEYLKNGMYDEAITYFKKAIEDSTTYL